MLKDKRYKLEKAINHLEYELNQIDDSELRMLIRYRYEDNLNYVQIAHRMNDYGEKIYSDDSVRMKLNRFFEISTSPLKHIFSRLGTLAIISLTLVIN